MAPVPEEQKLAADAPIALLRTWLANLNIDAVVWVDYDRFSPA